MAYYIAAVVTIHSKTYLYPNSIEVTYGPASPTPSPSGSSPPPTSTPTPTPTPTPAGPKFDFTVPSSVPFRDPIPVQPSIDPGTCTYQSHQFKFVKDGAEWLSNVQNDKTKGLTVTYQYPAPIGKGTNQVYMIVKTSCGTEIVGPKPVIITPGGTNQPPFVEIAWFNHGTSTPVHSVLENTIVDLGIVRYSDPDGDPIIQNNGWDFNRDSFWVKSLPGKYSLNTQWAFRYDGLLADIPGSHTVYLTVTDGQGGEFTASATLQVIDPKPVACIEGPKKVVEKRPLPYPISSCSTSPVNSTIVEEAWTNKKNQYNNVGYETVNLRVRDAGGRWSDEASHVLEVIPDMPPNAKLTVPIQSTRGNEITINSTATSPDGDMIVRHRYEYKYDSSNNGFVDDHWIDIYDGAMTSATIIPDKVGKYLFRETVWEDYGKSDNTDNEPQNLYVTDVVNLPPAVDVKTSGQTNTPKNTTAYGMTDIYNYWNFQTTYGGAANRKNWKLDENGLQTKTFMPINYFMSESFGLGDNKRIYYSAVQGNNVTRTTVNIPNTTLTDGSNLYNIAPVSGGGIKITATDKQSLSLKYEKTQAGIPWSNAQFFIMDGILHVFMGANPSMLYAFNATDGSFLWSKQIDMNITSPSYQFIFVYPHKDGIVFAMSNSNYGYVYRMMGTNKSGDTLWNNDWEWQPYAVTIVGVSPETGVIYTIPRTTPYDHATDSYTMKGYSAATGAELFNTWYGQAASAVRFDDNGDLIFSYSSGWYPTTYPARQKDIYVGRMNRYGSLSESRKLQIPISDTNMYIYSFQVSASVRMVDKQGRTYITRYKPEYQSSGGGSSLDIFAADGSLIKTIDQYYYNFSIMQMSADGLITIQSGAVSGGDNRITVMNQNLDIIAQFSGGQNYRIIYLDDQKILAGSTLIDGTTNPVYYPKAYEAGTPFSDIWFGGNWLAGETAKLNLKPTKVSNEGIGLALWVQNALNFYSVEFESGMLRFKRTAGGGTVTLREVPYGIVNNNTYRIKVTRAGNDFHVYVNEIYQFSVSEGWWGGGHLGIVNRGQQGTQFSSLSYESGGGMTGSISGIALINQPVTYDVSFTDPENDPRLKEAEYWTYTHNPNVFMQPEGTWSESGGSFATEVKSFPKPGEYTFTFRSKDDPHPLFRFPSATYDGYRQWSNTMTGNIRVHRPPVSIFTVWENGDHTLSYNDTSYDPDRFDPNIGQASTEATGIDYWATRGVLERKWRYKLASDSSYTEGKLVNPTRSGTWDIQLAVKDEYGAWSEWYTQSISTSGTAVNHPPVAVLLYPDGTQSNPTQLTTQRPTISWNQTDPDPGTEFSAFQVHIRDEWGNMFADSGMIPQSTSATWQLWPMNVDLGLGAKYQVFVRVFDGQEWSAWSNVGWMGTNRPPAAYLSFPWGTHASPNVITTTMPTITWTQTDPDTGTTFRMFQVEIANEAGAVILDSGWIWQGTTSSYGSWQLSSHLSTGQKLSVRVRVTDQFDSASAWSPAGWLFINRSPAADFDWSPKPVWEGDTVQLVNLSSDPDGDSLSYRWEIVQPDGTAFTTTEAVWNRRWLLPGDYRVTLIVKDVHGALSSVTKTIQVMPLTILSDVTYTPQWLKNHETQGHNTTIRPKEFYSGEIFVVETNSSPVPVTEASAWIDSLGKDGSALYIDVELEADDTGTRFTGQLFDERLQSVTEGLPEGIHPIHFRIRYANGVVKEEDVPVRIIGGVNGFVGVHRMQ
ncbi:PKD domain-containing protein [Paenibacillus contaminans]|nr:PKD domain-containing protein [Paenibacillus contaminans]